jgi:hypothetical protein
MTPITKRTSPRLKPKKATTHELGSIDWFRELRFYKPTKDKEQTRNFGSFKIPTQRFCLVDNLGDGHCLYYCWMSILQILGIQKYANIQNLVEAVISLRKDVQKLGTRQDIKKKLWVNNDTRAYIIGEAVEDCNQESLDEVCNDDYWKDVLGEVYDDNVDWHKFKPDTDTGHKNMQSDPRFVGPLLMENYRSLKFRVITFHMTIYANHSDFPNPVKTQVFIMDARGEGNVVYTVQPNFDWKDVTDFERTFFLFSDTQHINAMIPISPDSKCSGQNNHVVTHLKKRKR